ncbi:MAG: FmdB family zinc ribbon protein [Verrucomicrobiota bacterium]
MPIYEFHCERCQQDSEILVRSSDWKGTACPRCGSTRLAKKFSTFAASVAGGGGGGEEAAACSGTPSSCGLCGTGKPHAH